MPYGRRTTTYRRRSGFAKRRGGYRKRYTGIRRMSTAIRRLQRQSEIRYTDTGETTLAPIGVTGHFILLNPNSTGDTDGTYEGSKYVMKSLQLNYSFNEELTGGQTGNIYRCMVFYDKQPNGVAPTVQNLFSGVSAGASCIKAFKNWGNRFRFKVLYDRQHSTDNDDIFGLPGGGQYKMFKRFFLPSFTNGSSGNGIADINKGALWLFFASTSTAAPQPLGVYNARVRYTA